MEFPADFGVGIAGHDDSNLAAAEVVGFGLALEDAFNFAGAVAEGDELLEKLGVGVLDVVDVDHDVVTHFKGEVEFLDFLAGAGVIGFCGIERGDVVAEGGAVDFHEGDAEAVGDVFHEGGLAVAGRGNE